jgi:hypothetical protein
MTPGGHYQLGSHHRTGRKEQGMTAVVLAAVIGAAGTVLGGWIQGRAQRRPGGNTPGQAEQAVSCAPGRDGAATAPGRGLPRDDR